MMNTMIKFKALEERAVREGIALYPRSLEKEVRDEFGHDYWDYHGFLSYDSETGNLSIQLRTEPQNEKELLALVRLVGGRLYKVGGSVRDEVAGINPSDYDYVVADCFNPMATRRALASLLDDYQYGGEYPVLRFWAGDDKIEVSFTGDSILEDLSHRDTTMNAMAIDVETGRLIDPFGGKNDLLHGIVRHVNRESFNPLAAFRAARQLLQMEQATGRPFRIARETLAIMNECHPEEAPAHRICFEAEDAVAMRRLPRFKAILAQAGITLGQYGYDSEQGRFAEVSVDPIPASPEEAFWEDMPSSLPVWAA